MLPILSELIEAKTIEQVNGIRKKYLQILPDNQKWNLENAVLHAGIRIRRIENERKQSHKNYLN